MSAKTVAQKLLIKPESTVWSSDAERLELIGPLPEGVRAVTDPADATTAIVFAEDAATVRRALEEHRDRLAGASVFWVA